MNFKKGGQQSVELQNDCYMQSKGEVMGYKMIAFIPIPTTPNGMLTSTETLEPMKAQEKTTA